MHPLYDILLKDLRTDIQQMAEEGHATADLQRELAAAEGSLQALADLQESLWSRPSPASFAYVEPNDWDSIAATFPDACSHARFGDTDGDLADRLLAAWQGRCAGCQLGKPIEGTMWPEKVKTVLQTVGSWPLLDYMNPCPAGMVAQQLPDCDFFQHGLEWRNALCKGRFDHVAPDDDIHYAIISLRILEQHGVDFTSEQAADVLTALSPVSCLYAAGRNLLRTSVFGVRPPFTAVLGNPCRQSLGAQIRCDAFGWCAPGNPALAARMAYRDAVNSQTRNGIYSGMFFAVLMADVLAHGALPHAIGTALSYVPPRSRFAEMVDWMRNACDGRDDWEQINAAMIAKYHAEASRFNHSIPNAAIVLLGLLRGEGDFSRSLAISAMAGLDTDCTAATVGSILGCALGTKGIPSHWTDPFHDTIRTDVKGLPQVTISEMAHRTFEVARLNVQRGSARR
jgi:hypothetical protein